MIELEIFEYLLMSSVIFAVINALFYVYTFLYNTVFLEKIHNPLYTIYGKFYGQKLNTNRSRPQFIPYGDCDELIFFTCIGLFGATLVPGLILVAAGKIAFYITIISMFVYALLLFIKYKYQPTSFSDLKEKISGK